MGSGFPHPPVLFASHPLLRVQGFAPAHSFLGRASHPLLFRVRVSQRPFLGFKVSHTPLLFGVLRFRTHTSFRVFEGFRSYSLLYLPLLGFRFRTGLGLGVSQPLTPFRV